MGLLIRDRRCSHTHPLSRSAPPQTSLLPYATPRAQLHPRPRSWRMAATSCFAPPGSWCNGSNVVALPLPQSARALSHLAKPVVTSEAVVGGCCCSLCGAACSSSPYYSCTECTGAATARCASCYFDALRQNKMSGPCVSPPP